MVLLPIFITLLVANKRIALSLDCRGGRVGLPWGLSRLVIAIYVCACARDLQLLLWLTVWVVVIILSISVSIIASV